MRTRGRCREICEAPRLQSIIYLSCGTAEDWAASQPSSGFCSKLGKALVQLALPKRELNSLPAAQWVCELYSSLSATADHEEDAELKDWTLMSLQFRDAVIPAIAHKNSIVLCHTRLDSSTIPLEERFCILPQMMKRWRWKELHHVFTPSLDDEAVQELTSALVRDMCGLGRLVQLQVDTVSHNCVTFKVVPKLHLNIPEDAIATLSLVRTSEVSSNQRIISRTMAHNDDDCIATFKDDSLLRPACEYV